ncbi:MAG TPA: amidase [Bosea sp. (in: a-proteobacteria)]|uniref:amidase n=1 Tax=Bosea sp. (in: a-proteobacteria) TaxID=1871050 RepID=UPI002E13CD59|nr:amidase [Bosea sp. (in: a-proteobacteria)]
MTRPCDLSATEARRLIGNKQLSSAELVESCIAQIEYADPFVNAVNTPAFDRARAEAKAADAAVSRGDDLPLLHGLPFGVKELNDTAGIRTTYGSLLFKDHVPEKDDHVVGSLRAAGGIVIGKTNSPEFGAGANTTNKLFGTTVNPFDLERTCGGSSGGSAVALATNMMPLATGSDTGGSLRIPASFCGVTAFRGSPGVMGSAKRAIAYTTYQAQGPMARDMDDLALMLAAMATRCSADPLAFPRDPREFLSPPACDLSKLKVAFSADLGIAPLSRPIRAGFEARAGHLATFFKDSANADPDFRNAVETFWTIRGVDFIARHEDRMHMYNEDVNPNVLTNLEAAFKMTAREIGAAYREQYRLIRDLDAFFDEHDLLICPTVTIPPYPAKDLFPREIDGMAMENYVHWAALTSTLTVTGNPVVSLPCGVDDLGLPFGIQIVGRMHSDLTVMAAAKAIETLLVGTQFARPVPKLALGAH